MALCPICGFEIHDGTYTYCRQDLQEVHRLCGQILPLSPGMLRNRPGERRRWEIYVKECELLSAISTLDYSAPSYPKALLKVVRNMEQNQLPWLRYSTLAVVREEQRQPCHWVKYLSE